MKTRIIVYLTLFCQFCIMSGYSTNPEISKHLKNLSASLNSKPIDDRGSEMVVKGNTVHIIWVETQSDNYTYPMYYCRSTDLGKTWENPVLVGPLDRASYAWSEHSRKLAVDGNTVHIAYCDYKQSENGTGRIYYHRSLNNGSTFEPSKIVATTGGGYYLIYRSMIKAASGKVAIAYIGEGPKSGVWVLHSNNNGQSFTDVRVNNQYSKDNELGDFYFDGQQMIILHSYEYYSYGYLTGRVYVTVSNDNGSTVTTNKVSFSYQSGNSTDESCAVYQQTNYGYYARKIGKSGNNIHVVFGGATENSVWTILYARSTDNGMTFEKAMDMNNNEIPGDKIAKGSETILANNGNVYIAYLSSLSPNPVYFCYSDNNGNSYSKPQRITPSGVDHINGTLFISLVNDPTDASGKSFYLTGNKMFSAKSIDGGKSFSKFSLAFPFLKGINVNQIHAYMACDDNGGLHWISEAKFSLATDYDVFYRHILKEPEPGNVNNYLNIKNVKNSPETETVLVPSSSTLNFDSAMTAEAWVKFAAGNEVDLSILAKINGGDWKDSDPTGYNMGFRIQNNVKFCINSGIKTDKGDFVNWGDCTIADTLWHHIAFTYDANAGLNNFKTYVDGVLSAQQTVTGKIINNEGLLLIGARSPFVYYNSNYFIDEVRLWDKALSQGELIENQVKKFNGKEEGLRLYLNFDSTFKDLSGNGNDAIPVYNGNMFKSDFDPPIPGFDIYQNSNQVAFHNKTVNGKTYLWTMGDGTTLDKGNPIHSYTKSGEYNVYLHAINSNSKTTTFKGVTIFGLDHIEPVVVGNVGPSTFKVFGGSLNENTVFTIKKGDLTIQADTVVVIEKGVVYVQFDLDNAVIGKYTLVAKIEGIDYFLEDAITIEKAELADSYLYITGRDLVLFDWWHTKTINFGINGNVDIHNVPLFIAISDLPGLEVEFINVEFQLNKFFQQLGYTTIPNSIPISFNRQGYFPDGSNAIIYPVIIPRLAHGVIQQIVLRVKSPGNYKLEAGIGAPSVQSAANFEVRTNNLKLLGECLNNFIIKSLYTVGGVAVSEALKTLPVGCVKSTLDVTYEKFSEIYKDERGKTTLLSGLWDFASLAVSCAGDLYPPAKAYEASLTIAGGIMDLYSLSQDLYKCSMYLLYPDSVFAVSSFDPNEIIGPSGFSNSNYIQKSKQIPYTVLFENKSSATAPAHKVNISDTLDLNFFDLTEFGFNSFGWGDTVFILQGSKLKEFSRDIDLRPVQNLLVRVSGKLDTIKSIVRWEFLSLIPSNLNLEDDPLNGFLPPNINSPEGEGFVSFVVGLNKKLLTDDVVKNKATIIFDANQPIYTNEYINTIDIDLPESRVNPLNGNVSSRFQVTWSGTDKGSGVGAYSVFVLENDTLLYQWIPKTTALSKEFEGKNGSNYKFYSIAIDNVSLYEATPEIYDAQTNITVNTQEFENKRGNISLWPNPANLSMNLQFVDAPTGAYVIETMNSSGNIMLSKLYIDTDLKKGINIDIRQYQPGLYLLRLVYGNRTETLKFIVQ